MLISGYLMRNPAATMSVNYFLKGIRLIFFGKGLTLIIGISKLLAFELSAIEKEEGNLRF